MPHLEYECQEGHRTTQFFKTISQGELVDAISCPTCYRLALKIFSAPLGFGLYGDPAGYGKPSALKRFNTKTVSQKEGNGNAIG